MNGHNRVSVLKVIGGKVAAFSVMFWFVSCSEGSKLEERSLSKSDNGSANQNPGADQKPEVSDTTGFQLVHPLLTAEQAAKEAFWFKVEILGADTKMPLFDSISEYMAGTVIKIPKLAQGNVLVKVQILRKDKSELYSGESLASVDHLGRGTVEVPLKQPPVSADRDEKSASSDGLIITTKILPDSSIDPKSSEDRMTCAIYVSKKSDQTRFQLAEEFQSDEKRFYSEFKPKIVLNVEADIDGIKAHIIAQVKHAMERGKAIEREKDLKGEKYTPRTESQIRDEIEAEIAHSADRYHTAAQHRFYFGRQWVRLVRAEIRNIVDRDKNSARVRTVSEVRAEAEATAKANLIEDEIRTRVVARSRLDCTEVVKKRVSLNECGVAGGKDYIGVFMPKRKVKFDMPGFNKMNEKVDPDKINYFSERIDSEICPSLASSVPPVALPPTFDRVIFVTSERFSPDFGGLAGADAACTKAALADGAKPSSKWLAVLSSSTVDAKERFGRVSNVYNRQRQKVHSGDFWSKVDQRTSQVISNRYEYGIWSGSKEGGTYIFRNQYDILSSGVWGKYTCEDWTSRVGGSNLADGSRLDPQWLYMRNTSASCDRERHLLCMSNSADNF